MTTTATTASVTSSAAQQLLTSLGTGSGVDTASLVTSLVQAQFANQEDALTSKASALTTQISAVAGLQSGISSFAASLATLIKGGTLTTQPVSSNIGVLTATALSGAKLAGLSSSVTVNRIASAQGAVTATAVDRGATIGTGTLTLQLGTATYDGMAMTGFTAGSSAAVDITIGDGDSTIDGVAARINAANAGVTASVITDADGSARLSIRGATGTEQAFTLTASDGGTPGLSILNVGVGASGTMITSDAQNASLTLDGVTVERASNSVSDLIAGVQLQIVAPSATPVSLTATRPTVALTQAVSDFVDTYNQYVITLQADTDVKSGALQSDTATKTLRQSLARLTSATLLTGGAAGTPTTLAEIGVGTNRDGTLKVDSTVLAHALATWPDAVEAMFADATGSTSATGTGISGALNAISAAATNADYGLASSTASYTAQQSATTDAQSKLNDQESTLTDRLTQQFASMNSRVSQYKSIQSFLTQQVDVWTKSNN